MGGEEVRVTLVVAGVGVGVSRVRRLGDGGRVLLAEAVVVGGEEVRVIRAMGVGVAAAAEPGTEGGGEGGGDCKWSMDDRLQAGRCSLI